MHTIEVKLKSVRSIQVSVLLRQMIILHKSTTTTSWRTNEFDNPIAGFELPAFLVEQGTNRLPT